MSNALLVFTENMYQAIDNGKYFGIAQKDLSKAFDLVNHALLLQKLELYKCDGDTVAWFNSYLNSRFRRLCIKEKKA